MTRLFIRRLISSVMKPRSTAMKEEVPRLVDKFVRNGADVPRVRETFVLAQEFGA